MSGVSNLAILIFIIVLITTSTKSSNLVKTAFRNEDIVPDVILTPPKNLLQVIYEGYTFVNLGNELTPTQVKCEPFVMWPASFDAYYLLMMVDPDVPSRSEPTMRAINHWMIGNIPGNDVSKGEVLTAYVGSGPGLNTGLHRYVFLLYEQPGKVIFEEPFIPKTSIVGRPNFNATEFALKYGLKTPIAGNFYLAQWDEYSQIIQKQLGIN